MPRQLSNMNIKISTHMSLIPTLKLPTLFVIFDWRYRNTQNFLVQTMSSAQQFAHCSENPCVPPIIGPCKQSSEQYVSWLVEKANKCKLSGMYYLLNPSNPPLNSDCIAHFCDCTASVFLVLYSSSRSNCTINKKALTKIITSQYIQVMK